MTAPRKRGASGASDKRKASAPRKKAAAAASAAKKPAAKAAPAAKKAAGVKSTNAEKKTAASKKAAPQRKSAARKTATARKAPPRPAAAHAELEIYGEAAVERVALAPLERHDDVAVERAVLAELEQHGAPAESPAFERIEQLDEPVINVGAAPAQRSEKPASAVRVRTAASAQPVSKNGARPPAFPDTNYPLVERVLVSFVHDEVTRVGLDRVVLGLSGGVDSACAAAIAARALGPDRVLGVMMPYRSSSPASERDARAVAQALAIRTRTIDITVQIDAYFELFPEASKERRGNKMARERMTVLYDLSAAERALVLGTSNKTELLLGYGTLYGDMASALNPIGDLYKTQIWGLAEHLGVPEQIVRKPPSADLWEGQTDERELGFSYSDVDALLYRMVDERWSDDELVAAGFGTALVPRVHTMLRSSQFKRRMPLIAKVSERTIDADFRYPRDWGT